MTHDLQWVEVGKLAVGDELMAFDEYGQPPTEERSIGGPRRFRLSTVEETGRAVLPCYEVTLADGSVIVASSDHLWLTRDNSGVAKWTKTCLIKGAVTKKRKLPSKHQSKAVKLFDVWKPAVSYEAGYLAGMADGEGSLSASITKRGQSLWTLQIAQRDNAALARFEGCAASLGFDWTRYTKRTSESDIYNVIVRGGRREILRALGTLRPSAS